MAKDVRVALALDVALRAEELDRGLDEAGDVEDEEDEGADDDEAGQHAALVDEQEHEDDEDDGEGADGDAVGHDPVSRCHRSVHLCRCCLQGGVTGCRLTTAFLSATASARP